MKIADKFLILCTQSEEKCLQIREVLKPKTIINICFQNYHKNYE